MSDAPTEEDIQQEIAAVNIAISSNVCVQADDCQLVPTIADIFDLPIMVDPEKIAIVKILISISPACHIIDSPLYPLISALQAKLSIQYGNSPASAISYATYALMLLKREQNEMANQFGKLAYRIVSETDAKDQIPETVVPIGLFVHHRHAHLRETLAMFQLGYQTGLETGKLEYVGYCGYAHCLHAYWSGEPLGELEYQSQIYRQQLLEFNRINNANYCAIVGETALALLGNPDSLPLTAIDAIAEAKSIETNNKLHLLLFYLHRAMYRFLLEDLPGATADIIRTKPYTEGITGTICKAGFYFYDSLIALANVPTSTTQQRVTANQIQLGDWAHYAPMNYLHKWLLVEAEKNRGLGNRAAAIDLYDRAIAAAKINGYTQEEALANELAAKFYLDWGKDQIAAIYMQEAYYSYGRWQAKAKTDSLEQHYPHLFDPILHPRYNHDLFQSQSKFNPLSALETITYSLTGKSASSKELNTFDLASVLQSAQALSSTIEIEELIHQLSQIILKNSGAETCLLILPNHDDEWQIQAISTANSACPISAHLCQPLVDTIEYPANLIYWIKNSQQSIIFDARQPIAINDKYLVQYQPQSVFGLPILKNGVTIGVVYLEHRHAPNMFTDNHKTVISFLCTQAAIALENAKLYQQAQTAAADVRLKQRYFAALLDNIPHVAWLKDEQSHFIAVNQPFAESCGYETSELIGKSDFDLWKIDTAQKYRSDDLLVMASGERQIIEENISNVQGENRWLETIKTPIKNSDGTIGGTVGIALDITDRKQHQLNLHQTNQRLELTNAELRRATRLKDEFLATMSHELRTPLNAILGMSEALQDPAFGSTTTRQLKSLQTIESSGRHLLSLINDILDVSKISAGKLELSITPVSVSNLCHSSLAFVKQQAHEKQLQLDVQLPTRPGKIAIDERRMRQVLINLLSNAVKFTPNGGKIALTVTRHDDLDPQLSWIDFAISDTGIGINSSDFEKLFQPFVQVDSSLNRHYEGTGLGLTLVKQIAELHGGSVTLQSEIERGSCFTVRLPHPCLIANLDDKSFDRLSDYPLPSGSDLPMKPALILLAEDNIANSNTFCGYLNAKGYQTIWAKNGKEAIDLAQSQQPDLILMDIQMPEMDGLEAIDWIRGNSQLAKIPIIAITALAMEGDRERCLAAGANEYLTKPVKLKQLASTIQSLIRN